MNAATMSLSASRHRLRILIMIMSFSTSATMLEVQRDVGLSVNPRLLFLCFYVPTITHLLIRFRREGLVNPLRF